MALVQATASQGQDLHVLCTSAPFPVWSCEHTVTGVLKMTFNAQILWNALSILNCLSFL